MATYAKILKDTKGNHVLPYTRDILVVTSENCTIPQMYSKLWVYKATLTLEGWSGSSETGFTQTAATTPYTLSGEVAPPNLKSTYQLMMPMILPTGNKSNDANALEALNIINEGFTTPGNGNITVKVWEKPATAVTIYWEARAPQK